MVRKKRLGGFIVLKKWLPEGFGMLVYIDGRLQRLPAPLLWRCLNVGLFRFLRPDPDLCLTRLLLISRGM